MNGSRFHTILVPMFAVLFVAAVVLWGTALFGAATASAAGSVSATATIDGKPIAGANAANPVRLDPNKVTPVVIEVKNETANPVTLRRVDFTGHVLGLNFFSYSTSVELTVAAGKTEKLTYRLDPAGLDGQATGLIGSDLTLINSAGDPVTSVHTVVDVRGSLVSVYGLFGIILSVLTGLAIADSALTVARHRLSVNRWQRGLRLLAPGIGIGLMIGFTASVARWWVPGTGLWLALAGVFATLFFLAGYLSPTPRDDDDLGLDKDELAAALELDGRAAPGGTRPDLAPVGGAAPDFAQAGGTPFPDYSPAGPSGYHHMPEPRGYAPGSGEFGTTVNFGAQGGRPATGPARVFGSGDDEPTIRTAPAGSSTPTVNLDSGEIRRRAAESGAHARDTGPGVVIGKPAEFDDTTVQGVDSDAVRRRAGGASTHERE
ncbi:hypothetical protein H0264_34730 [Nocardia huaxiensis]|uniref:Uncharacterized protein n=1 Tax=Nocardia huaxiensis TaxID=2755382 RepID=A0A7D6VID5_9NOCA|nr:hypothetical protein [Nocardia huaxiensis]QLY30250.1 hypothetical protein H0264_34730 [Nocardia huaxiensis]